MRQTSCHIFRINKNITIISEFTVPYDHGHDGPQSIRRANNESYG